MKRTALAMAAVMLLLTAWTPWDSFKVSDCSLTITPSGRTIYWSDSLGKSGGPITKGKVTLTYTDGATVTVALVHRPGVIERDPKTDKINSYEVPACTVPDIPTTTTAPTTTTTTLAPNPTTTTTLPEMVTTTTVPSLPEPREIVPPLVVTAPEASSTSTPTPRATTTTHDCSSIETHPHGGLEQYTT